LYSVARGAAKNVEGELECERGMRPKTNLEISYKFKKGTNSSD